MSRVVGIDLSLRSTGVALLETDPRAVALRRVRSTGARADSLEVRSSRLRIITQEVADLADGHDPRLVVVEGPSYASTGAGSFDRHGLWWLLVRTLHSRGLPVVEVSPSSRAKYATGVGGGPRADKDQVLAAVIRRYPWAAVDGNDVADAMVLACLGARWLREPVDDPLPQANLAAVEGVTWPAGVSA